MLRCMVVVVVVVATIKYHHQHNQPAETYHCVLVKRLKTRIVNGHVTIIINIVSLGIAKKKFTLKISGFPMKMNKNTNA